MGVKGLMKAPPALEEDSTVAEACKLMHDAGTGAGAVAVVDGGELQGIFTYRDLIDRVLLAGHDPQVVPVLEVMTRHGDHRRKRLLRGGAPTDGRS